MEVNDNELTFVNKTVLPESGRPSINILFFFSVRLDMITVPRTIIKKKSIKKHIKKKVNKKVNNPPNPTKNNPTNTIPSTNKATTSFSLFARPVGKKGSNACAGMNGFSCVRNAWGMRDVAMVVRKKGVWVIMGIGMGTGALVGIVDLVMDDIVDILNGYLVIDLQGSCEMCV